MSRTSRSLLCQFTERFRQARLPYFEIANAFISSQQSPDDGFGV
jgi:hypothetical protein